MQPMASWARDSLCLQMNANVKLVQPAPIPYAEILTLGYEKYEKSR